MVLRPPDTCLLLIVRSQIKCSVRRVALSCPTLCNTKDYKPARLLCPWGLSRPEYQRGLPFPSPGGLPNPGTETRTPPLQEDSLPPEPPGSPKLQVTQPNLNPISAPPHVIFFQFTIFVFSMTLLMLDLCFLLTLIIFGLPSLVLFTTISKQLEQCLLHRRH